MPDKRKREDKAPPVTPSRPSFLASLRVEIPPPHDVKLLFQAIQREDKTVIYRGKLSSEEVDQLVNAFKEVKVGTINTLNLENVFSLATVDRTEDLEKIWNAVKNKIQEFKLGHNNLPIRFTKTMEKEINEEQLPIKVNLVHCEFLPEKTSKKRK